MTTNNYECVYCGTVFHTTPEESLLLVCCGEIGHVEVMDTFDEEPWDGFNSDAEADADVLASAGWGTDEDYGYFGGDE